MTYKLLKAESVPDSYDIVLTVLCTPGWVSRKFGERVVSRRYRGWLSVWHLFPDGNRCNAEMECMLSDFYMWVKYNKKVDSGDI